jgi:hypothetical protein
MKFPQILHYMHISEFNFWAKIYKKKTIPLPQALENVDFFLKNDIFSHISGDKIFLKKKIVDIFEGLGGGGLKKILKCSK